PSRSASHPPPPSATSTPSLHDALPIFDERGLHHQQLAHEVVYRSGRADVRHVHGVRLSDAVRPVLRLPVVRGNPVQVVENHLPRSEEHTSELQSRENLVCRLLLEKKNK